ncbi:hypothetical protein CAL29_16840 [Bordetella genomosp. 10]|uniref:Fido domain-containing protein n=1 Tax=Bordetella genomosp. 10 TaxID=1416804 RepID=A0A261RZT7_9BORD|nr:Fic family protein [Bordetella genomosp. 10]OZI29793.1 hypothetical protein CAL29_16840 [Bordetella genomosp. 10]
MAAPISPNEVGYGHIAHELKLRVSGCQLPARIDTRVLAVRRQGNELHVPASVAPASADPLAHLEFALKYQGIDLEIIQAACAALLPEQIQARLNNTPNGKFTRIIAALYEAFTGTELQRPALTARYVNLFDPDVYVCGPARRQAKFNVNFNGLGDLDLCPIVRRTPDLEKLLARDIFGDLHAFVESIGGAQNLDRALGWAYLDETRSSFAIEHEAPSDDKARRFVQLLHSAHDGRPLSEDYLTELQRATITNPLLEAFSFRHEQNWLQQGGRLRASSITYMPPPPDDVYPLMQALTAFANGADTINPLLKAFLVSFAFVFIHPFMDGNGRISRFLVHHGLCRSGKLEQGLILPISVAMSHHESEYLSALESVSRPIRGLWNVMMIDDGHIDAQLTASGSPYRYWDATKCLEFGLRMTHYALDTSLIKETEFLKRFDIVRSRINARYDLMDRDLHALIRMAHSNGGTISQNRRKQYLYRVPPEILDAIETEVREVFLDDEND